MKEAETRYSGYEQELLALVEMHRVGCPYLDGKPFTVKTDHRVLPWLQIQGRLSKRQAGWLNSFKSSI